MILTFDCDIYFHEIYIQIILFLSYNETHLLNY